MAPVRHLAALLGLLSVASIVAGVPAFAQPTPAMFWEKLGDDPKALELHNLLDQFVQVARTIDISQVDVPEDAFRTIPEVVRDKGYHCEQHTLTTDDGFLIQLFRVKSTNTTAGYPVLLSHGLIDSAGSWILNPPGEAGTSFSYVLADEGFDVWLGNVRNNEYGSEHLEYDRYSPKMWENTFDKQGTYDVPNTIDYIRNITGAPKIAVVGHSQGCSQMFSAALQHPHIASKVSIFVALAPAGYMAHLENLIIKTAAGLHLAEWLDFFGVMKFIELPDFILDTLPYVCQAAPELVQGILSLVLGQNPGEWNLDRLGVMCAQSPGWTSVKNMVHWSQLVRTAEFSMFDYGYFGNKDVYGQPNPPAYDLSLWPTEIPVAVFYGGNDELVEPGDAEQIIADLPNSTVVYTKYIPEYAHCDFHWGVNAGTHIYYDAIDLIRQYM